VLESRICYRKSEVAPVVDTNHADSPVLRLSKRTSLESVGRFLWRRSRVWRILHWPCQRQLRCVNHIDFSTRRSRLLLFHLCCNSVFPRKHFSIHPYCYLVDVEQGRNGLFVITGSLELLLMGEHRREPCRSDIQLSRSWRGLGNSSFMTSNPVGRRFESAGYVH